MIGGEAAARAWLVEQGACDEAAMARLEVFIARLNDENSRQNLVAQATLAQVWQRHICDSAQLLKYVPRETTRTWLDLGTGAGFPGVIISIMQPDLAVILVESRRRRVDWLQRVIDELGLTKTRVIGQSLERVQTFQADVISARAFAPLSSLLDLAARFSTQSTLWLLPKGRSAAQELSDLQGWRHTFHVEQSLTDPQAGIVIGNLADPKGSEP